MSDEIDQTSFASILAGVKRMRQDYEIHVPGPAPVPDSAPARPAKPPSESAPANPVQSVLQNQHSRQNSPHPQQPQNRPARRSPAASVHSYTAVQVAQSQKGNPLLESPQMKMTSWTYNGQILSDYYINATVQVLFLSLKYHKLRPEYVWRRLDKLRGGSSTTNQDGGDEALRVLLVVVDIDSPHEVLRKLAVMCVKNDLTLVVAWSFEEAGNYVAALKANEMARTKVDSAIQGVKRGDYNSNIVNLLTAVRAVNKTDVANLLANCKSFRSIVLEATSGDGLSQIPGLGQRKVENLAATFSEPFIFNKQWS